MNFDYIKSLLYNNYWIRKRFQIATMYCYLHNYMSQCENNANQYGVQLSLLNIKISEFRPFGAMCGGKNAILHAFFHWIMRRNRPSFSSREVFFKDCCLKLDTTNGCLSLNSN